MVDRTFDLTSFGHFVVGRRRRLRRRFARRRFGPSWCRRFRGLFFNFLDNFSITFRRRLFDVPLSVVLFVSVFSSSESLFATLFVFSPTFGSFRSGSRSLLRVFVARNSVASARRRRSIASGCHSRCHRFALKKKIEKLLRKPIFYHSTLLLSNLFRNRVKKASLQNTIDLCTPCNLLIVDQSKLEYCMP